jgi:hypothetical protein
MATEAYPPKTVVHRRKRPAFEIGLARNKWRRLEYPGTFEYQ